MNRVLVAATAAIWGLSAAVMPVAADDMADLKGEAVAILKGFGPELLGELKTALEDGGPVHALGTCNVSAPSITAKANEEGWQVARTSLKLRNPGNAPDAWEAEALAEFEARKAAGEDPAQIAKAAVVEADGKKVFRFMKAIPTAEMCLTCHGGDDVKSEVEARLKDLYPADRARGYNVGDIRGAFTLKKPL